MASGLCAACRGECPSTLRIKENRLELFIKKYKTLDQINATAGITGMTPALWNYSMV